MEDVLKSAVSSRFVLVQPTYLQFHILAISSAIVIRECWEWPKIDPRQLDGVWKSLLNWHACSRIQGRFSKESRLSRLNHHTMSEWSSEIGSSSPNSAHAEGRFLFSILFSLLSCLATARFLQSRREQWSRLVCGFQSSPLYSSSLLWTLARNCKCLQINWTKFAKCKRSY